MKEKLIIKNFGPIKNVELELGRFNVLIGDQGTGKSTVAKLLTVIKKVLMSSNIHLAVNGKAATYDQKIKDFDNKFREYLESFGILNYLKTDSSIEFRGSGNFLKYEYQKILVDVTDNVQRFENSFVISYIPAYREASILLKDSLNAIAAARAPLPTLFYSFGQNLINAKKAQALYDYTDILSIKYKYLNDNDIIVMKDGKEIAIEEASNAINSIIPLLLVFDNAVESNYTTPNRITHLLNCPYIIIEEPELNCFPATQKKLIEHFISKIKYQTDEGFDYYNNLIITTHSPYILTSVNNLMYAYQVGQVHSEEVENIIGKNYWLNQADVSAYKLLEDGTAKNILDDELKLIEVGEIDEVSRSLNEVFDKITNIEYNTVDEH